MASDGGAETNPSNPNCFAWCLMNVCISKILQQVVRKMVAGVGLELLGKGSPLVKPQLSAVPPPPSCRIGDCFHFALLNAQDP